MALKRHETFQIGQSGASPDDVLAWDGTKWTPSALTDIGGTSIYTGSGTIGAGVVGSSTTATLPTGGSDFYFNYSNGNEALHIDNTGSFQINSMTTGKSYIQWFDTSLIAGHESTYINIEAGNSFFAGRLLIDDLGATIDTSAAFEIASETGAFYPPRMGTADRNAIGAGTPNDGAIIFNIDTLTFDVRADGQWASLQDSNSIVTATNGLSKTGNNITLGGVLTQNTTITNANLYNLTLSGDKTVDYLQIVSNSSATTGGGIQGVSTGTGAGIQGRANGTGTGVWGYATGGGDALTAQAELGGKAASLTTESTTTNSVLTGLSVMRNVTTGNGADGIGVMLEFGAETNSAPNIRSNTIRSEWVNAINAGRSSKLSITTVDGGTEATKLELSAAGQLKLNSYGGVGFTGVVSKFLQVDSTGAVIQGGLTGLGGIYSGSGDIGLGVGSSTTNANVPTDGVFNIRWSNTNNALKIDDMAAEARLRSRTGDNYVEVTGTKTGLYYNSGASKLEVASGSVLSNTYTLVDRTGVGVAGGEASASFEVLSTTGLVYVPRVTTAQRTAIAAGSPNNGGFCYDSDLSNFQFRQGGAWVTYMVDAAGVGGIYKGSGTIATGATATTSTNSFFKFEYAGGNDAFILDSTTGSEQLEIRGKSTGGDFAFTRYHLDYLKLGYASTEIGITLTEALATVEGKIRFSGVSTPATFGATQNDYDSGAATHMRLETTVNDTQITGLTHGAGLGNFADADGRILFITNIGATNQFRLMNNNAGSQSEYRFAGTAIVTAGMTIQLIYDGTSQRWRIVT